MKTNHRPFKPGLRGFIAGALAIAGVLCMPASTPAQTQTYPCETVMQFGTGMSAGGAKLRPGSVDPFFDGTSANFPDRPDVYVVTDPPAVWIDNSTSADSQWIGPSPSVADDVAGTYVYRLQFTTPCAGARVTGRYAASDRAVLRLNGAAISFPTPATGWTAWTAFSFNNLPAGNNTLEFYVTNTPPAVGGPPGPTGLRAELTATATCCPCIVLDCPSDIFLTTCSNGATANFSITGTNRCYTNLTINCSLNVAGANIPVTPNTVFPPGTNNVSCDASDTVGHRTNCTFRVVVTRDTRPPEIRCPSPIVYFCQGGGTNVFYNVTATDDVDPSPVITCVPPSGTFFPPGTNTVTCEARDDCGRISRCSFPFVIAPNGFVKTLQAGVADNFMPGLFEPTASGPCMAGLGLWNGMPFDTSWPGRYASHSFLGLPNNITAAKLILHMKPTQPASLNDILGFGLTDCTPPTSGWLYASAVSALPGAGGTWQTNPPTTFTFDFATLPGGSNLIAALNTDHRLDFAVGTETMVDYARLELTYCGPQTTLSGVSYSLQNAYPVHQGGGGVSWQKVNSNGPPPTVEIDIGGADGFRLGFAPGVAGVPLVCDELFNHTGQKMTFVPAPNGAPIVAIDLLPGTNFNRRMLTIDPSSIPGTQGTKVEVWHDNVLVSRYFFPGGGTYGATVPANACVASMGFTSDYWFANFTSPQDIDLDAPEVPGSNGVHLTGQVGRVITGNSVRLYFYKPVAFDSSPKSVQVSWVSNYFNLPTIALLRGDDWIDAFGPQQLTLSDAILSKKLFDLPFGNCINATPNWMFELQNPVADFCYFDGIAEYCSGGYVDVNIKGTGQFGGDGLNFGGLRLTPALLPLDVCRIDNTVVNSTANSVVITRTVGSPVTLNNVTTVETLHWPVKITGNAGPQSFAVDLPPNTTVTASGQTYNATRVTFNANPLVLTEFYKACIETVTAPQISMMSMTAPPTNTPPAACLTLNCPTNVIVNCTNSSGTVVTFNPAPSGATRCGSNVIVTCVPPSGSVFPPGTSVVLCTAIDSQGNQDQCRFLVTVRDVTAPQLVMPARIIVPCTSPHGAAVEFTASAIDQCDPAVVVECHPPSGSVFPVGTNYVTCTAVDAGGNRSSQEFPVIVAGGCGTNRCLEITVPADLEVRCGTAVNFTASARDICTGGSLSVTCAPPSGTILPAGLTRVVCTTRSGASEVSASFTVEVIDDTPPELTCPSNMVVAAQSERGAIVRFTATGPDDCASSVRVRCTPPSGSAFPVGQTQVLCEGTDGNGNVGECSFTVTVNPAAPLRVTRLRPDLLELRWTGDAVVEFTDILNDDDDARWLDLLSAPESNGVERVLRIVPTESHRFFRLRLIDLLPPPDTDGDGVPDLRDRCPDTPAGLPVDQYGCALFDLITTPERVFDPERATGRQALRLLQFDGGFTDLVTRLSPALVNSNSPSVPLGERLMPGALNVESNFVHLMRAVLNDFLAQKPRRLAEIERGILPLGTAHADVRPQDWELERLEEIEEGLRDALGQSEISLVNLSNVVRALNVRDRRLVTLQSFDARRGSARLSDGRLLVLPRPGSPGAPPIEQIQGAFAGGSGVFVEVSQLSDGSWFGHSAEAQFPVNPGLVQKLDPRTLALRIVPASLSLPDWDTGVRHRARAYKWGFTEDTGYHFLEYGMAFAVVKRSAPEPGYLHWVKILTDGNNDGGFAILVNTMHENSPPFVMSETGLLPRNRIFPIIVREFRAPIQPAGGLGASEVVGEETLLIEMYDWGYFAEAVYSRTRFELEDRPDETSFQTAQVTDLIRNFPLTMQDLSKQTFKARGFTSSGNSSSYPDLNPVRLNVPFAVHFQDANDQQFFVHPNDRKRGLNDPTVSGINNGRQFIYRASLPRIVRDRLHTCSGTDTYYRIPLVGEWDVSQGNNGEFTHNGNQKYAFDFPKDTGATVLAARGGIVTKAKESSSQSCWDPDADDGEGACVNCTGSASGNAVRILHQDGTEGVYVHFKKNGVLVSVGQRVYRGDVIGKVGTTGCSTGPHLHFHVVEEEGSGVTIPIKFETYDDDDDLRNCYVPPHDSDGTSTNWPWDLPFPF